MRLEVFGKLSEFLWPLLQETFDVLDDPHGNSEVALRDEPCCDTQADRGFVAFNEIARIFQRLNSEPLFDSANDAERLISVIAKVVHRESFDVLVWPDLLRKERVFIRSLSPSASCCLGVRFASLPELADQLDHFVEERERALISWASASASVW